MASMASMGSMFSRSPSIFCGLSGALISLSGLSFVASIAAAKLAATRLSVSLRSLIESFSVLFDWASCATNSSSYFVGAQQRQKRKATVPATTMNATRNTNMVQSQTVQTTPLTTNYVWYILFRLFLSCHNSSLTSATEVVASPDSELDFICDSSNYYFYYAVSSPPLCFLFKNACCIMLMPSCMSMSKSTSFIFYY